MRISAKNIEAAVDEYVLKEEGQPQQQDSPLNEPITLAHLKTAQDRLNSASCHAKDTIPNAALKISLIQWLLLLLALLNAILHLMEFPLIWKHVLLCPLMKGCKSKSRQKMTDHRHIGLISSVAKLLEQILLPRLTLTLLNTLSPDQTGGWMGADAAALYV